MTRGPYGRDANWEGPRLRSEEKRRDSDLRATPFTEEVFADERPEGRGRGWSLLIGLLLGVAVIVGVGWYAFKGRSVGLAPGEVQTVKADPSPYKVKPDNPGGMQVDNQDKLVYDRVTKGAAPNRVENLLPPPEEPKAPPVKPKPETPPQTAAAQPEAPQAAPAPTAQTPQAQLTPAPKAPASAVAESKPTPTPPNEKPADDKLAGDKPAGTPETVADEKALQNLVREANAEPAKAQAAKPQSAPPGADALAAAVAAATGQPAPKVEAKPDQPVQTAAVTPAGGSGTSAGGGFQIQLASVPSEDAAQAEWTRLSARHKDLLAFTPVVTRADLGDKGIYYRLRAGPFADKAAADAFCSTLTADKISCVAVRP